QRELLPEDVEEAAHPGRVDLDRIPVDGELPGRHDASPWSCGPRSGWGSVGASGRGSVPRSIGASTAASTTSGSAGLVSAAVALCGAGAAAAVVTPSAARIRSGDAGRSWTHAPVASW